MLHDLRAPLGVAHGYLRLLREGRLESEPDRDRALAQTSDALGRMTRLCADAASLAQAYDAPPPAGTKVPARLLAEQVTAAMGGRTGDPVHAVADGDMLRVSSLDSVAAAMATIVAAIAGLRPRPDCRLTIDTAGEEFRALLGGDDDRQRLALGPRLAFDPWGGYGLSVACACLTVERNGGVVWCVEGRQGVVGLALPLEVSSE